ncbi:MAG: glutaredoxin 3 [Pseudomonadales bacterium]|jgi:glutaredoxin 3
MIEMYTKPTCPFCHAAKRVFNELDLEFVETDVMLNTDKRSEMLARSEGRTTVPQIFIHGQGIGGFTDLVALIEEGKFPKLLEASA